MPQVSKSSNPSGHRSHQQGHGRGQGQGQGRRGHHTKNVDPEAQRLRRQDEKDKDIGLPRLVARIWGLVSGISYVSNGGYLVVQSQSSEEKCQAAGAYMIFAGLAMIILECGCCIFQTKNNCCDSFENKFPFWARGLVYLLSIIPALALCFGTKTLISSIIVITLALIYVFLTCLVRSKRYERLRGAARSTYQHAKKDASRSYNAVSGVNTTVNYMKMSAAKSQKHHGRPVRPKKHKPRAQTTST